MIDARNEDEGVKREYAWIRENYHGATDDSQDLILDCTRQGSHHDAVHITTANGQKVTIYFDINSWFGKR